MADRHRASGDALATVKLFKILFRKDLEKEIVKDFIKLEIEKGIANYWISWLPTCKKQATYITQKRKIDLYWQKPKHQKRINQHFTGTTTKCKKIQDEVLQLPMMKQVVN
jgi:DNA polymerase-3 subunit epsilon